MLTSLLQSLSNLLFMALHVTHSGSFPKPLSAEEEKAALTAFHENGDMAARNRLVEHNLRLVAHIVKKYYGSATEQEELISIGTIGLIKAVGTFDYEKGTRLATYASRCIENEILMHFRAVRKMGQDVSMNEPIETDREGNPLTLQDVLADGRCLVEELEQKINGEKLGQYIKEELDERETEVICRRYGFGCEPMTQREVAAFLDISRSYVSRIEKKALSKLRRRFEAGNKKDLQK